MCPADTEVLSGMKISLNHTQREREPTLKFPLVIMTVVKALAWCNYVTCFPLFASGRATGAGSGT